MMYEYRSTYKMKSSMHGSDSEINISLSSMCSSIFYIT